MNKDTLKEVVKTIVSEEQDYKEFFKRALEKAGKSIPSMSDEEKKAFFNKIDAAWDSRGEKNEELHGNQHKLDVDGDGEIEASDLAKLRAKKDESVTEAKNDDKYVVIAFHKKGGGFVMTKPTSKKDAEDSARSIRQSSDIEKQEAVKVSDARKIKGLVGKNYLNEEDDLDIGHTDDEPNMLKSTALELAQYAAKLVKKLDQYDKMPQEVDFPNWWQAKLILAKDYVHGAYHYLDSKETLGEGRAFVSAAKKAKEEGKTEFEFNGKKYPVTIKD
jgi:hypothetical protein